MRVVVAFLSGVNKENPVALINGKEYKFYAVPVTYGNMESACTRSAFRFPRHLTLVEKATWEKFPGKTFFDTEDEALLWGAKQVIPNLTRVENPKVREALRRKPWPV